MSIEKNDLVYIIKRTRGRHTLPKAEKGENYLVISWYTNDMGTTKYIVIDSTGNEYFTTEKCIKRVNNFIFNNDEEWQVAKKTWMDKTYVPVFGYHKYAYSGMPFVSSRDGNSRLVTPFGKENHNGAWINKTFVHTDDVKIFLSSSFPPDASKNGKKSEVFSFRIPLWLAERNGFYGKSK